ncbi:MAG: hypothetical protein R2755_26485 [Acidimicrobiales bacterium]
MIDITDMSEADATSLIETMESQFWDHKSLDRRRRPQEIGCSLANADGSEFTVGISVARWQRASAGGKVTMTLRATLSSRR